MKIIKNTSRFIALPFVLLWRLTYPPIPKITPRSIIAHDLDEAELEQLNHAKMREYHDALETLAKKRIARLKEAMTKLNEGEPNAT